MLVTMLKMQEKMLKQLVSAECGMRKLKPKRNLSHLIPEIQREEQEEAKAPERLMSNDDLPKPVL